MPWLDVRIVSATNRDLRADVQLGRFRDDLYYRLNVGLIEVPPLRQRTADIAILWEDLIRRTLPPGAPMPILSESALQMLEDHDWPGNVRELRKVASRALGIKPTEAPIIDAMHIQFDRAPPKEFPTSNLLDPVGRTLAETEEAAILYGFMQVFPFTENSGKVARLLMNLVLLRYRYLPAIIHAIDRQRYYETLRQPNTVLRALVLEAEENSLENAFKFFAQLRESRRARVANQ